VFILSKEEVLLRGINSSRSSELDLYNQVFVKDQSFSKEQRAVALTCCRAYLDHGKICLVVEEEEGFTLWQQRVQHDPLARLLTPQTLQQMHQGLQILDRPYRLRTYARCFIGAEAVTWFSKTFKLSPSESVQLGQKLIDRGIIHHVLDEQTFQDGYFFYRFYGDEPDENPVVQDPVLTALAEQMHSAKGVDIRDRRYRLRVYTRCFIGSEAVAWLMGSQNLTRTDALRLGQQLMDEGHFHHVVDEQPFRDEFFFYRFYRDESL